MEAAARAEAPFMTVVREVFNIHDDRQAWTKGAEGEEKVGRWLAKLPPPWKVWHDLPIGTKGANVDHVVIGPGGVFSINTKKHGGKVWLSPRSLLVSGKKTSHLPKAVKEAARVQKRLNELGVPDVAVCPVLAIICTEWKVKKAPEDVVVLFNRELLRWLKKRRTVLDDAQLLRIATAVNQWSQEAA
jgi:hypothetical protein